MRQLYPELDPLSVHHVAVGESHSLYVEECGTAQGIPVLFLHGGPGSGCKPYHRCFFDPERYRIILFDQRGAGRSTPHGALADNTTQDLIEDIERIRRYLGVEKWLLFGGSWGATLALVYALSFPHKVLGLILRGTFLADRASLEWFFGEGGVRRIFPDAWEAFVAHIPVHDRRDLLRSCYQKIVAADDRSTRLSVAKAWSSWGERIVTFGLASSGDAGSGENLDTLLAKTSIEVHYAHNRYFLNDDFIMDNIDRLPAVPVTIVHGRRDLTCTLDAAWALRGAITHSQLIVVPEAGHLASEPAMIDALVRATDEMGRAFDSPHHSI